MVGALLSLMLNFMTMGIHVVSKSSPAIRWVTSGSHPSWRRMLGVGALSNSVNNTAALQSTPNSALGINANSPSPFAGLNSVYGPWIQPIDLGWTRRFNLNDRHAIALQVQVFNLMNHANFYVQNGTGVNSIQYTAAAFGNNRKVNLGSEKTLEAKAQRKAA